MGAGNWNTRNHWAISPAPNKILKHWFFSGLEKFLSFNFIAYNLRKENDILSSIPFNANRILKIWAKFLALLGINLDS